MDYDALCLLANQVGVGYRNLSEHQLRAKLIAHAE